MKKLRLSIEDSNMINDLVNQSPKVQMIENGKFKFITIHKTGISCIDENPNGKDLAGNPFKPNYHYTYDNQPVYYNLRDILKKAFMKNGKQAMIAAYQRYLDNHEKAKALHLKIERDFLNNGIRK